MNAGTIVGYITQPNGSPISGAEIWICETTDAKNGTKNPSARTDSRGYFQLAIADCGVDIGEIFGGKVNVVIGKRKRAEKRFQLKGYLISETLRADD